jgi:hypothetical protein
MRRTDMRRAFPLALTAIATIGAAAGCGSPGSKPAAQDTQAAPTQPTATKAVTTTRPAAGPRRFVSPRYSFRVTLTGDWSENDAQVAWTGKKLQGLDSGQFANFNDPTTGRTLVAAAAHVPKRMRLAEWRAAMVRAAPSTVSESSSAEQDTLGGEPALAWTATGDGYHVRKLAALHGTRGYMIFLASPQARNEGEDQRTFDSIRRSFRFTR